MPCIVAVVGEPRSGKSGVVARILARGRDDGATLQARIRDLHRGWAWDDTAEDEHFETRRTGWHPAAEGALLLADTPSAPEEAGQVIRALALAHAVVLALPADRDNRRGGEIGDAERICWAKALGARRLIVAVTRLDTLPEADRQAAFGAASDCAQRLARRQGFKPRQTQVVAVGASLLAAVDALPEPPAPPRPADEPLRLAVVDFPQPRRALAVVRAGRLPRAPARLFLPDGSAVEARAFDEDAQRPLVALELDSPWPAGAAADGAGEASDRPPATRRPRYVRVRGVAPRSAELDWTNQYRQLRVYARNTVTRGQVERIVSRVDADGKRERRAEAFFPGDTAVHLRLELAPDARPVDVRPGDRIVLRDAGLTALVGLVSSISAQADSDGEASDDPDSDGEEAAAGAGAGGVGGLTKSAAKR